jgi:hypothetical protein
MNPAIRPYQIIIATEIRDLATQVNDMVAAGWEPQGGPFHVGVYNPPFGGLGQAIFRRVPAPPPAAPQRIVVPAPAKAKK